MNLLKRFLQSVCTPKAKPASVAAMMANTIASADKPLTGRRAQVRRIFVWSAAGEAGAWLRKQLKIAPAFRMQSGGTYTMQTVRDSSGKRVLTGAFVRVDKDRRSVKERKRARRELRGVATAA